MALITEFERNENNEVVAIVGKKKIVLPLEYLIQYKPQIGDEYISAEPTEVTE